MNHIALCFDNNIAEYAFVTITSILCNNNPRDFTIHVFHDGSVTKDRIDIIRNLCTEKDSCAVFYDMQEQLDQIPKNQFISKASFLRLFVASAIDLSIEKILYMDVDTVVVDDLDHIFSINLMNAPIAAVPDLYEHSTAVFNRIGIDESLWFKGSYINAGVIMINAALWRKEHYKEQLIDAYMRMNSKDLSGQDQDVLNAFFWSRIQFLDIRYNFGTYFMIDYKKEDIRRLWWDNIEKGASAPVIIHFAMGMKPWHYECHVPYTRVWRYYARKSRQKIHYKHRYGFSYGVKRIIRRCGMAIGVMNEEHERAMYEARHYLAENRMLEYLERSSPNNWRIEESKARMKRKLS